MTHMTRADTRTSPAANRLRTPGPSSADLRMVRTELDAIARELALLWSSALARGDFDEITRLVDASHAVHRAVVALSGDNIVPAARVLTP